MSTGFRIGEAQDAADIEAVAALFRRYAASLPVDLDYQDFAAELAGLPGKYAPPRGAVLLARGADGEPLGCVALRGLDEACCEMKRLFLVPEARGRGLGRALTLAIVDLARPLGYRELRLDTLRTMTEARALYARIGFEPIAPYYSPTPEGTAFMALKL
jgi:GNAT superfamily N-acetyltransferase